MFVIFLSTRYTELESRTQAEVCRRWKQDNRDTYTVIFYGNDNRFTYYADQKDNCNIQYYNKTGDDDVTLRQLNFFRWLTGFKTPIYLDHRFDEQQQQCSIINARRGSISHTASSWDGCYTSAGSSACGASNLAQYGITRTGATLIGQFICDNGNPELGHRRWCLHDNLVKTSFGGARRGNYVTLAMRVFDYGSGWIPKPNNRDNVLFTAYPSPGYFPADLIYPYWSFWSASMTSTSGAKVSVKINGVVQTVKVQTYGGGNNFRPTIVFTISGYDSDRDIPYTHLAGKTIDVQVTQGGNTWDYTIKPVDCEYWKDLPPPTQSPSPSRSISPSPSRSPSRSPTASPSRSPIPQPPTKSEKTSKSNEPTKPEEKVTTEITDENANAKENDKNKSSSIKEKSLTIPIVVGCAIVLILVLIVIGIIVVYRKRKRDIDFDERNEVIATLV